jgi:hypothetical protein
MPFKDLGEDNDADFTGGLDDEPTPSIFADEDGDDLEPGLDVDESAAPLPDTPAPDPKPEPHPEAPSKATEAPGLQAVLEGRSESAKNRIYATISQLNLRADDPLFPVLLLLEDYLEHIARLNLEGEKTAITMSDELTIALTNVGRNLDEQKAQIDNLIANTLEKQIQSIESRMTQVAFRKIDKRAQELSSNLVKHVDQVERRILNKWGTGKKQVDQAVNIELEKLLKEARKNHRNPVSRLVGMLAFWMMLLLGLGVFAGIFLAIGHGLATGTGFGMDLINWLKR